MDIISTYWSFEQYISVIRNDIFAHYLIPKDWVIIEIAPWEKTKVWVWLSMYWFTWTLYVVEPRAWVLDYIVKEYTQLLPQATIIWVPTIFQECAPYIKHTVDAIICNAILDDVIVSYSTSIVDFDTYYKEHFWSIEKSAETWSYINQNYSNTTDRIVTDWHKMLSDISPQKLIISQYKSYFYETNDIVAANTLPLAVLNQIKTLWDNDASMNEILESYQQDPDRWACIIYGK